jgi:hypothetical protein
MNEDVFRKQSMFYIRISVIMYTFNLSNEKKSFEL